MMLAIVYIPRISVTTFLSLLKETLSQRRRNMAIETSTRAPGKLDVLRLLL